MITNKGTVECQTVPYSWVVQTRSSGRIVTPWGNSYFGGGLFVLTTDNHGAASGCIVDKSRFMYLRNQRIPRGRLRNILGTVRERASIFSRYAWVFSVVTWRDDQWAHATRVDLL
ncbi:MAG: hypothetical protein JO309_02490 [Pseudonocardiales bacterium]|nr:hypothetical protein [Pseudonocardiales bacterium]MBV9728283.1 hypothetical protein [Pseudonocardiales bacterium]